METVGTGETLVWRQWEWVRFRYGDGGNRWEWVCPQGARVALRPALQGAIPFLLPFSFSLRPGTV